ncbi:MAG: hypothetical protein ACFE8O_09975 [Candidatus Hermodarchaeota archaeon]
MKTKNKLSNPSHQMQRAGTQIFTGAMILFVIHVLLVLIEMERWMWSQVGAIIDPSYIPVIILPIGWIFIGVGYRQFGFQTKMVNTKVEQQNLTYWTNKSGTLLIALAIISMIFNLALSLVILIFFTSLISIILQFIIGVRLRMWNAPEFTMPAEVMIPGGI